jgi:hypothetical protein
MAGRWVREESDVSIHIKNQNAGVINNVDGGQVVYGGQHGIVVTGEDARRAVRELRGALAGAGLSDATAAEARAQVAEIDRAVHAPQPDKHQAAGPLKRLVELLADAGSLATAGAALVGPLQTLAGWLGAHGAAILSLLAL